jgi:ribosomal protein L32
MYYWILSFILGVMLLVRLLAMWRQAAKGKVCPNCGTYWNKERKQCLACGLYFKKEARW